jgi:hypothetical protein
MAYPTRGIQGSKMQDYYYLYDLEKSRYSLSQREALHLAAKGTLPSYVFVDEDVRLYEMDDDVVTISGSFSLRLPTTSLRTIEKCLVSKPHSANQLSDDAPKPSKKHKLSEVFLDGRYKGSIPIRLQSRYYSSHEICPFPFRITTLFGEPFTFLAEELIFWTDDLEELVEQGLIERRDNGEAPTVTVDDDRKEYPSVTAIPNDETELKRLQRTVAALALGLAAKPGIYSNVGKPNVSQLAKLATEHLRDGQSDRTPPGFSDTTVRNTITAALKACPELKG